MRQRGPENVQTGVLLPGTGGPEHPTFNNQPPTSSGDAWGSHWMLKVRCWLLDVSRAAGTPVHGINSRLAFYPGKRRMTPEYDERAHHRPAAFQLCLSYGGPLPAVHLLSWLEEAAPAPAPPPARPRPRGAAPPLLGLELAPAGQAMQGTGRSVINSSPACALSRRGTVLTSAATVAWSPATPPFTTTSNGGSPSIWTAS